MRNKSHRYTFSSEPLFTIPLFSADLSLDNETILDYCTNLWDRDLGRDVSNSGGWQSNDIPVLPEELERLFVDIHTFAEECCEELEISPVKVYNMWVNINQYKDFNWPHDHSDSALAGVYYVKTPNNCGDIAFEHPVEDKMTIMPSVEGRLYIFPAWLRHRVNPNMSREERVSISFNLDH
tara:strand:+ start:8828 stop:9367 length:540 start_codon:yes stop_codon:yes gene_type:complete